MTNYLVSWFADFASLTGVAESLAEYKILAMWVLMAIGITACVIGFWTYRADAALLIFFAFAYLCTILMGDSVSWGAVVTCFTVGGIAIAGMALLWHKVDGVLLCGLIGAGIGFSLMAETWTAVVGAIVGILAFLLFPVAAICVETALGGSILVTDLLIIMQLEQMSDADRILMILVMAAAGAAFQLFASKEQTIFKKIMPDSMRVWLERRGEQHA